MEMDVVKWFDWFIFHQDTKRRETGEENVTVGGVGLLVDSEIVLSTRYGKTRVFINKTLYF